MATTNGCDVNQLDSDSLLPPRKRLLAGFKKQNSNSNGSPSSPLLLHTFASSSSTSNSNGSSSASADVQIHLDNLVASHHNDQNQSLEELAEASKVAAALASRVAKAARSMADEKARIAARAVAAAKTALELVASFPNEASSTAAKEKSPRKNKQKKHVPVQLLYSKDDQRENYTSIDEDLTQRLHRAINNSPRVSRTCSGSEFKGYRNNKRQKNLVSYHENTTVSAAATSMYDGNDIAGVVDSDTSNDELDRTRTNGKLVLSDKVVSDNGDCSSNPPLKEKAGDESSLMGKRRGRVKLKKLPLSICTSKDQGNGTVTRTTAQSPLPVINQPESSVTPVIAGQSWKCQDLKSPECVKQNKAVRS